MPPPLMLQQGQNVILILFALSQLSSFTLQQPQMLLLCPKQLSQCEL